MSFRDKLTSAGHWVLALANPSVDHSPRGNLVNFSRTGILTIKGVEAKRNANTQSPHVPYRVDRPSCAFRVADRSLHPICSQLELLVVLALPRLTQGDSEV